MPRTHSGVLSSPTLSQWGRVGIAILVLLSVPAHAWAEGAIARAVRVQIATGAFELSRPAAQFQRGVSRSRGPGRIVAGAAVGATAGFFAGGYLGAVIDGDCDGCDDPGFKGAIIGAPIGAVVGGIFGGKFLF
jgi:hypothetical protein